MTRYDQKLEWDTSGMRDPQHAAAAELALLIVVGEGSGFFGHAGASEKSLSSSSRERADMCSMQNQMQV
jgi:hypothetical protein